MSCPFRIGDKIICIRTTYTEQKILTKRSKIYKVVEVSSNVFDNVGIIGEHGFKVIPNWNNFKIFNIKENRKEKINKLNENW